jgi:hypothetical protein
LIIFYLNILKTIKKTINNDKNVGHMVATVHKYTNVPLILIVCDVVFCMP